MAAGSMDSIKATKLLFYITMLPLWTRATSYSEHDSLRMYLTSYSKEIRPVFNGSDVTNVTVVLHLLSIVELREQDQALVTNARLKIRWTNQFLTWAPAAYGGIASLLIPQTSLWKPDIVLGNAVSSQPKLGHDGLKARVYYDGTVEWTPTQIFETSCEIDVTYYPMDTQKCTILLQPEMYDRRELLLAPRRFQLDWYTPNGQWDIEDTAVRKANGNQVYFQLKIRRRRFFFVLNLILPVVFLSLTTSLVFALPADAGEKVGLSVTVLLAYAVYLVLVTDSLPKTSMQASVVSVYLMLLLGLCTTNVVLTVLLLRLFHRPDSSPPVSGKTLKAMRKLRLLLRYKASPDTDPSQAALSPAAAAAASPQRPAPPRGRGFSRVVGPLPVLSVEGDQDAEEGDAKKKKMKKTLMPAAGNSSEAAVAVDVLDDQGKKDSPALRARKAKSVPPDARLALIPQKSSNRFQNHGETAEEGTPAAGLSKAPQRPNGRSPLPAQASGHYRKFTVVSRTSSLMVSSTTEAKANGVHRGAGVLQKEDGEGVRGGEGVGEEVTWKTVAETLNFLLFVVCSVVSVGTTFLCILALLGGSATDAIDTSLY